jgi:hypothetical protein
MSEVYWWQSPWTLIANRRYIDFFPELKFDFSSPETINRWTVYSVYTALALYLFTGSLTGLVYSGGVIGALYLWNSQRTAVTAPSSTAAAGAKLNDPTVPPIAAIEPNVANGLIPADEPSRNILSYDERLAQGLFSRSGELPARVPIVASKQRKAFARQTAMTGDQVPYAKLYELDRGMPWRPRMNAQA